MQGQALTRLCSAPNTERRPLPVHVHAAAHRYAAGLLLRELLRAAPEAFAAHAASEALPVAFGAKMDDDVDVAAMWKEVGVEEGGMHGRGGLGRDGRVELRGMVGRSSKCVGGRWMLC